MAKQIIESTRPAIPSTAAAVALTRANANTGMIVRYNGIDTTPPQPVDARNIAQLCNAATQQIVGILLEYTGPASVRIGIRGRYAVTIVSGTTPAAGNIGQGIISTTTAGEADIQAKAAGNIAIGSIADFDGQTVYIDL